MAKEDDVCILQMMSEQSLIEIGIRRCLSYKRDQPTKEARLLLFFALQDRCRLKYWPIASFGDFTIPFCSPSTPVAKNNWDNKT